MCAPWDEAAARAYAHGVPEAVGFFHGWGEAPARPLLMARGTPYLHYWLCPARPDAKKRETKDAAYFAREGAKLRRIVEREGLPCFVAAHLSCYWSTPSDVPKIVEAVGTDIPCELLLPDQFLLMMRQHLGDRILVRPLTSVLLMPGVDTGLALHLTSTRAQATSCTLRLLPPPGASVAAASQRVRIEPFGRAVAPAVVRAAKPARGRHLTVELGYGTESERRRIPVRHVPPVDATQAGWLLHSLWEAEGLSHNAGAPATDADAHNGSAWHAVPGKHQAGTHIVWGPYEELPPGRYTAAFRVKVGQRTDAAVGRLDVFNHWLARQGKQGVRAVRLLRDTDFAAKRRYQDFSLDFERTATGKVEYRVHWTGRTPLSVDRIVVFRRR